MKTTVIHAFVFLATLPFLAGCDRAGTAGTSDAAAQATPDKAPGFSYAEKEIPGPKPWTAQGFKNKPDDFQFAIIGDRGGGANPRGTYERAIEQLNWLQPEFVMSVGGIRTLNPIWASGRTTGLQDLGDLGAAESDSGARGTFARPDFGEKGARTKVQG